MPNPSPAGADNFVLQTAIGAYSDEAYTSARKLTGTAIVGDNPMITTDTENFVGQLRWMKPLNPKVNTASLTDRTDGEKTNYASDYSQYIKTVRTHGAEKVNMQQVVTRQDGLAKISRDFAETKAGDENGALMAVMKGVAISEALNGAAAGSGAAGLGGQTFENEPGDRRYGMYVDLGASLVADRNVAEGAARAEGLMNALGMGFKDYEPEYAYLVTSPATMASFRSANLIDGDSITEGNVTFNTLFNGKLRLIMTRANQSLTAAEKAKINTGSGVDIIGNRTSFLVLPGSFAMKALEVPEPVEIVRKGDAFHGGGTTTIWYRWGYAIHPAGYSWQGNEEDFPDDPAYFGVTKADGTRTALTDATITNADTVKSVWRRKTNSALSLGIMPIFHN